MNVGEMRDSVALEDLDPVTPRTPDGLGGWTEHYIPIAPSPVFASVQPASDRNMDRLAANAPASVATHVVWMRLHPKVTTQTRLVLVDSFLAMTRVFAVRGVQHYVDEDRSRLFCEEVIV